MSPSDFNTVMEFLQRVESKLDRLIAQQPKAALDVADDRELDSQWGDPEVRRDPKQWVGPSMVGKRYSQTSPEFLDKLAGFLEWRAGKEDEEGKTYKSKKTGEDLPVSPLTRKDAARARGWARRMRNAGGGIASDAMRRIAEQQQFPIVDADEPF